MTKPIFNRQKLLLELLKTFGGELSKIELQKYMFLYLKEYSDKNYYAFVPYYYGSFSFEMYKDIATLERNGFLKVDKKRVKLQRFDDYIFGDESKKIFKFFIEFKDIKTNALIEYIYKKYPYYAIKSKIADKILDKEYLEQYKPKESKSLFFTIGYEGKKFEEYLNELIQNNIKVLVDVRKNAYSMKYGFSKKTLQNAVESLGIDYIHMPKLGIESQNRKSLKNFEDYQKLFKVYEKELQFKKDELGRLFEIFKNYKRVAITCFEKDIKYCHRGVIAKNMQSIYNMEVRHI